MAPRQYKCEVDAAAPDRNGAFCTNLKEEIDPGAVDVWYKIPDASTAKQEMLATALAATTTGRYVLATLDSTAFLSELLRTMITTAAINESVGMDTDMNA